MPVYDSLLRSKQACASLGCAKEARVLLDGTSGGTSVDPGAGPGYGAAAAGWAAGAAAVPGLVLPVHPSARIVTLPRTMIPALRNIRRLPAVLPPSPRWSRWTLARCDATVHFGGRIIGPGISNPQIWRAHDAQEPVPIPDPCAFCGCRTVVAATGIAGAGAGIQAGNDGHAARSDPDRGSADAVLLRPVDGQEPCTGGLLHP